MARRADIPSDRAIVVSNPDDAVTPEPVDPGVKAADTLAEARAAGEV